MLKNLIESLELLSITHGDTTKKISSYDAAVIAKLVSEGNEEQREVIANVAFKSFDHFKSLVEAAENKDSVEVEVKKDEDKDEEEKMNDKIDAMKEEISKLEAEINEVKKSKDEDLSDFDDASKDFTPDAEKETLDNVSKDAKSDDKAIKEEPGSTRGDNTPVPMNPNRPGKVVTPVSKRDDGLKPVTPVSSRGDNSFTKKITPAMGEVKEGAIKRGDNLDTFKPKPAEVKEDCNCDKEHPDMSHATYKAMNEVANYMMENPNISPAQKAAALKRANMRSTSAQNDPRSIIHAKPKPAPKPIREDDAVGVGVKKDNDDELDIHSLSTIDLAQRSGEVEKDDTIVAKNDGDKEKTPESKGNKKDLEDMVAKVSAALKGGPNPFKSGPFGRGR